MHRFQKTNRSAFWNFLLAKYEMYTGAVHVNAMPYYISIDPSDRCQLRCTTCPTGIENEARRTRDERIEIFRENRRKLTPALFQALIEELGEYLFLVMFYNYGEPLLNPHVADFIRVAKTYQIETELHSNLSLPLADERIEELLTSGLDRLLASIDGFSQETYQTHRVGGELALVKNNLERLARTRDRLGLSTQITYGFLVFSFNEHEIPAAQRYCDELGIDFLRRDAFVDDRDWLPSYRKAERPWIVPEEAMVKRDCNLGWSPLPQLRKAKCPSACAWHYGYSIVTGGGRVAPCCAVARESYDLGEVVPGTVRFGDVWNNAAYRKSRASFVGTDIPELAGVETVCMRCPYPEAIQHLYSYHDSKVVSQFQHEFRYGEPVLAEAFDRFCRARFGAPMHAWDVGEITPDVDHLFVGAENQSDTAAFVDFFEKHFTASDRPSGSALR